MNKKRLEVAKKKRQHERQQKRAAVKKERHKKALKEIEVELKKCLLKRPMKL